MKIYIQSRTGNYNLDRDYPEIMSLEVFVAKTIRNGGYFCRVENDENAGTFVPWHEVEYVRGE